MMEPDRDLVGRKHSFVDPITSVPQESANAYMNLGFINANVLVRSSRRAGPSPDISEHPLVKLKDEVLSEEIAFTYPGGPSYGFVDICLFGFIEISSCRDPGLP